MTLQPTDAIHTAPQGVSRSTWQCAFSFALALTLMVASTAVDAAPGGARLSSDLQARLAAGRGDAVDVIVNGTPDRIERLARRHGLTVKKTLSTGAVLTASGSALAALAADAEVDSVSADATVQSQAITTQTTGAEAAWSGLIPELGATSGRGVGVAIIDSGIASHPSLAGRVVVNLDFTDERGRGGDGYGHGTHIAGIVAAKSNRNGVEGAETGMAPGAHLLNLKVLGADGSGKASDVIEAIDWAIANKSRYAIRVLNLSLGMAPTQSYRDDPLCQAVERAARAGLVVVASAGNFGQTEDGRTVLGSVTSPGISPFAITVGALRTQGTVDPSDDTVAPWSSRGPTNVDHIVKPDLVAPGSRIVSTAAAGGALMSQFPDRLVDGPGANDYFAMSGTSMSAAVVSGAVALLLESKPALSPLLVKLALQGSAEFLPNEGLIAGGAGRLRLEGVLTGQVGPPFLQS